MMTHKKIGQYWCEGGSHSYPINLIKKRTVERKVRLGCGYVKKIFKLLSWKSGIDVLIENNQVPVLTTVFRKPTFTGLLLNFTSFKSYSYKWGLIRTLIDGAYKINSTWLGFHQETTKIRDFLLKNSYLAHIIDKAINSTINKFFQFNRQNSNNSPECFYVKLPYVGKFSAITQKRIRRSIQRFCDNSLDIKLMFSSFKIGSLFSVKDLIPTELKSCVVYTFRCAGCGVCYVGETSRHFCIRINEHLNMNKASHIFKHLQDSPRCRTLCSSECFVVNLLS